MSLFPAYSENAEKLPNSRSNDLSKDEPSTSWLQNSSYVEKTLPRNIVNVPSESSDEAVSDVPCSEAHQSSQSTVSSNRDAPSQDRKRPKHTKKRKKEKRRKKESEREKKPEYERDVKNLYYEDKYRDRGNSTVKTLCSRVRSFYDIGKKSLGFVSYKQPKKHVYERYYVRNIDCAENVKKKDTIIKRTAKDTAVDEEPLPSWCTDLEELQRTKIKEYNEKLTEEPNNIELWVEYIELQDAFANFQKYQSLKDVRRAATLKKLSIVEKAMEKNVESAELLKLKLSFMGDLLPADQFSKELESLVNKDSGNVVLWQKFIMAAQTSVAICTVPKILELYSKCFCILKQRARTNPRVYDERLLQMLHWCLTFLRHTGLWEQMWETIRLNLSLNLNLRKDSLYFPGMIDEKKLISMEEVILLSRLPLNQLWQRTESLRENCHWVSVSTDELELVGDSRRFVLPDDVADFVHPIISQNSNFRLAIHSLLLLKVPLLPTRDFMLKELTLKEIAWGVESSEVLLPFVYPSVGEMAGHKQRKELLDGILEGRLTSGPQYLMFHPAQEPYLDFLRDIFRTIAETLPSLQRTSIYVWWLRFERLLIFLHKDDPLKYDNKGKKLKATLKEFLKKEENRNNLHFYREYALLEREMGRFDNCVNILETAIQSQSTCPSAISNVEERSALISLYRTIFEVLLYTETYKETHKQRILNIIEQMVPRGSENQLSLVEEYLESSIKDFTEEAPAEDEGSMFFLPNLRCDLIVCYAYFLYTRDCDIRRIMSMFTSCINHYKNHPYIQEILYEGEMALLQLHCERSQEVHILNDTLNDMLNLYPNNFYALSILACIESEVPLWKFNSHKMKFQLWNAFAMCLSSRRRIHCLKDVNDAVSTNAAINKLLSLHRTLAKIPATKCCPLLWRLYMLFLREYNLCEKKGEEVYHESIEQCPWARSIYIDAAEVAPQLLTQVQDVIREKELRMHVTPEELDILRG